MLQYFALPQNRIQLIQNMNDLLFALGCNVSLFLVVDHTICPLLVYVKHSDLLWYKFR